jgi:uncharacterized protein (TIGR02265 family)
MRSSSGVTHPDALEFAPPRFDRPIDVDSMLAAVPSNAANKGVIVKAAFDAVRARPELAAWTDEAIWQGAGQTLPLPGLFQNVAFRPYLDVLVFGARLLRGDAIGEGLREIGMAIYPGFVETLVGRMVFGALGRSPLRVLMMGPNGWRICNNFGEVHSEQLDAAHLRYDFLGHPFGLLETLYVGTVEGACRVLGITPEIAVARVGEQRGVIDIRWSSTSR